MTQITLKQIRKSYGSTEVIHGIDLEIGSGEFVVFVGPSGCGKSTLLRIIAGLEDISGGELEIDGTSVNHIGAADRGLAMVFQSYALYPHMSVYKNMAFGLENTRMPKAEIEARVTKAADLLQITPYLRRKPKALSGGQRQRVAIGRAIVRDPKAFLFDEPLSNLDAELRVTMRKELAALHHSIGGTMIYVTHDQTEAMTLADKIVVLQGGVVQQVGAPLELYNQPQNLFVAGFIGSPRMNLIEAEIAADGAGLALVSGPDRLPLPALPTLSPGDRLTFGIRPEHLQIVEAGEITITVTATEQLGGETYIYGQTSSGAEVTVHQLGQLGVRPGETLQLSAARAHLHLFDAAGQAIANGVAP